MCGVGSKLEPEYDLSKMKKRPNPFAKQLKRQVTISLGIDVIEYFENMAQEAGISSQELINIYLQDCVVFQRKLSIYLSLDNQPIIELQESITK